MKYMVRICLAVIAMAVLAGCGGGSGGGNAVGVTGGNWTASGRVTLPPGMGLALSTLKVQSGGETTGVAGDGTFSLPITSATTAHLTVVDSGGHPILTGFVSPNAAPKSVELSARSSAEALLFYVLGAFEVPAGEQDHVRAMIAGNASVGPLATALSARIAASPTAVMDGDPQIVAAVQQALNSIGGSRATRRATSVSKGGCAPPSSSMAVALTASRSARSGGRAETLLYTVSPSAYQSGVFVGPNPNGSGIIVINNLRRNLKAFFQRTGYQDAAGNDHPDGVHVAHAPVFIPATNSLSGVFGSLVDVAAGNVAYAPVTSAPVDLDFTPSDARRVYYHINVVGNGTGPLDTSDKEPDEIGARAEMEWLTLGKDLFLPLLASFLNVNELDAVKFLDPINQLKAYDDLVVILQGGVDAGTQLSNGNVKGVLVALMKAFVNNATFRQAIINWISHWLIDNSNGALNKLAASAPGIAATAASYYIAVVDKFLGIFDASLVVNHWASSDWYERWDATAIRPNVRISPATATVTKLSNQTFTVLAGLNGNLTYHWKTSGKYGHLTDSKQHSGKEFDTTDATVTYHCDSEPTGDSDTDTLEVEISEIVQTDPIKKSLVGLAGAVITVQSDPCKDHPVDMGGWTDPSLSIAVTPRVVRPGDTVNVRVTLDYSNIDSRVSNESVLIACAYADEKSVLLDGLPPTGYPPSSSSYLWTGVNHGLRRTLYLPNVVYLEPPFDNHKQRTAVTRTVTFRIRQDAPAPGCAEEFISDKYGPSIRGPLIWARAHTGLGTGEQFTWQCGDRFSITKP